MLSRFPTLRLVLVDPYDVNPEQLAVASARLERFRKAGRATQVLQGSIEASTRTSTGSLHLVFVDGNHSYAAVQADIHAWWPLLRPGGLLIGHDYHPLCPGVVKAVNEFALELGVELVLSTEMWWVWKPEVQK